ncbi:hypothetical protein CPB84DRAFT_1744757 [Gymnopilus junonius]|uniref:Uncharacterized protein n=1 Tax=Gymnopilus junonius TaxID=109634 RepID=A0A9P5TR98_GYMJU|nr:hypothetical protein CPB84DRAFT_1744757 [Gymnopilus junonius]
MSPNVRIKIEPSTTESLEEFVEPPTKITKSVKPRPGSPEFWDHSPVTIIPMDIDEAGTGPSAQPDSTKRIHKPTWKVLEGAVLDGAPESKKPGQIHTASAEESSDLDLFKLKFPAINQEDAGHSDYSVQAHASKAPGLDSAYDSGPPKSTPHHHNKSSHPHTNDSSFDSLDGFIIHDDEDTSVHKSSHHQEKSTHKQDHSKESDSSPVVKDHSHSDYQGKGKQPTHGHQSSTASESEEENIDVHPAKMSQNKHCKSCCAKHKTSSDEESDSSMAPSHHHKRNTKASSGDSSDSASDGDGCKSHAVKKNNKKKKSTKHTDSSDHDIVKQKLDSKHHVLPSTPALHALHKCFPDLPCLNCAVLLLPFFHLERDMQYNGIQNQQLLTFAPTLQAMDDDESARVLHQSQKFVSHGIYANPISADPEMFSINKTHIVHKPGNSNTVFILTGAINKCNLVSGALHGTGEGYLTKKLMLFIFEENFNHFAGFFGMVANFDEACCHFYGSSLLFATMKQGAGHGNGSRAGSSSPKKPGLFQKSTTSLSRPSSFLVTLNFDDNVPIYDGRGGRFNFKEKDFDNLQSLPLYCGGKKDLPPYAIVSMGFTFNVFHMQNDGVCASFNIMFIIYLGMTGNDGK